MADAQSTRRFRFTKTAVEAAAPLDKPYWDADLKGFGLRVSDRGTRTYFVHGRMPIGRQVKVTIGRHGALTCEQARARAKALLGQIAGGDDPAAAKRHARCVERERRAAPTLAELCDRYVVEYSAVHHKPSNQAENRRMIEQIIKPRLGRLKVEALDHDDVARLHRDLKRTPRQANHVVAVLSKMMNLAELWRLRPLNSNPCRHLKRYPENARDKYASPDELERIGAALRELEAAGKINPADAACIRFLALVGCRLSEAVALELHHVDFRTGEWRLPDAKTGKRTIMLGAPALALLAPLGTRGRAFGRSVDMVENAWGKVRARAGALDLRLHDLRHTVGTYAGASGASAFLVRDLLGHRTMAMTGRYVSRHVDPLRAVADAVSAQVDAALGGSKAEVVPLRRSEPA
jgi:integrase